MRQLIRKPVSLACAVSLLALAALACGGTATAVPTPDAQATVGAAIAATGTAQAGLQETIDAAVAGTQAVGEATRAAVSTPTPAAEYVEMTEEELAALIDQAVVDAAAATEASADAAAQASADGTVTQEEADEIEAYVLDAEEAVALAEELIYAYYALYGELAAETIDLLVGLDEELSALGYELAALVAVLEEIDSALQAGLALSEEVLGELEAAAQAASGIAAQIQAQKEAWIEGLPADIEGRVAAALAVEPNEVAGDRKVAILSAFQYVDAVRGSLADDKVSPSELADIAQLGANASAGLSAHGGPQLQGLAGSIDGITGQIAGGQMPQAKANVGALESALGTRPPRP